MENYDILVYSETVKEPTEYKILASSPEEAQLIAFILNGGFNNEVLIIDASHYALVYQYTENLS